MAADADGDYAAGGKYGAQMVPGEVAEAYYGALRDGRCEDVYALTAVSDREEDDAEEFCRAFTAPLTRYVNSRIQFRTKKLQIGSLTSTVYVEVTAPNLEKIVAKVWKGDYGRAFGEEGALRLIEDKISRAFGKVPIPTQTITIPLMMLIEEKGWRICHVRKRDTACTDSLSSTGYVASSTIQALDRKNGFRELRFGQVLNSDEKAAFLRIAHEDGWESFERRGDIMEMGEATVASIRYFFNRNRFGQVKIEVEGEENIGAVRKVFEVAYGKATKSTKKKSTIGEGYDESYSWYGKCVTLFLLSFPSGKYLREAKATALIYSSDIETDAATDSRQEKREEERAKERRIKESVERDL